MKKNPSLSSRFFLGGPPKLSDGKGLISRLDFYCQKFRLASSDKNRVFRRIYSSYQMGTRILTNQDEIRFI